MASPGLNGFFYLLCSFQTFKKLKSGISRWHTELFWCEIVVPGCDPGKTQGGHNIWQCIRETGAWIDTIKEHPLTSTLVGIGLGWALTGGLRKFYGETGEEYIEEARQKMEELSSQDIKARMQAAGETIKSKAQDMRCQAMDWSSQAVDYIKENPLVVVGAAMAIGAAVGLGMKYIRSEEEGIFCATCGAPVSEEGTYEEPMEEH